MTDTAYLLAEPTRTLGWFVMGTVDGHDYDPPAAAFVPLGNHRDRPVPVAQVYQEDHLEIERTKPLDELLNEGP